MSPGNHSALGYRPRISHKDVAGQVPEGCHLTSPFLIPVVGFHEDS